MASAIGDILSLVRTGAGEVAKLNELGINSRSIARGAKDATFQFPCLVSDSLPIDMANTIARMLDRQYASWTQTWLSYNATYDITIDPTPLSYLKKLHQNTNFESTIDGLFVDEDDYEAYREKVYTGEYRCCKSKDGKFAILFNVADKPTADMIRSHRKFLQEYMDDFDLTPLENVFTEDSNQANQNDREQQDLRHQKQTDLKNRIDISKASRAPKMTDRELKRANDTVPYGIEVRLMAINDKHEFVQYMDIVVGVKTILHPVSSDEMINNVTLALRNRSFVFRFLRWTTGEITLVKDLILNIDDLKRDANDINGNTPFFATLKRLKRRHFGIRNLTVPQVLIPNATFVMTSYEVDYINKNFGINLRDSRMARKLFDAFLLMSFIIVDEGMGTVSVLTDADKRYQVYALETLERDNDLNSNKLGKEIGRMISH